jgi:tetratricopeptide (TPR) repeat protein
MRPIQLYLCFLCYIANHVTLAFSPSSMLLKNHQLKQNTFSASSNNKEINVNTRRNSPAGTNTNTSTRTRTRTRATIALHMASFTQEQLEKIPPRKLIQLGMQYFKQGDIDGSIELFDKAEQIDNGMTPFLWQRGISYYYMDRFQEGSDQFRYDVKVNPLDVEEIVWDIACQYMILNKDDASSSSSSEKLNKMSLPKGKTDRRKIMSTVYSLYRGDGATEHDLADAGHTGSVSDEFYSLFYLGLWCEANGETTKAENYMRSAVKSSYSQGFGSNDYMTSVAKVHCKTRGWSY